MDCKEKWPQTYNAKPLLYNENLEHPNELYEDVATSALDIYDHSLLFPFPIDVASNEQSIFYLETSLSIAAIRPVDCSNDDEWEKSKE
jgi:hypothetical protein